MFNFVVENVPVESVKLAGDAKVPCRVCSKMEKIAIMQDHVGIHVLRAQRVNAISPNDIGDYRGHEADSEVSIRYIGITLIGLDIHWTDFGPHRTEPMWLVRIRWM